MPSLDAPAEGVAVAHVATLVAAVEPELALLRGAVRPRLLIHAPLRRLLDAVVAHRRGRVERLGDVLRHEGQVAGGHGVVRPDPGVAVRLQLRPHRVALWAAVIAALAQR